MIKIRKLLMLSETASLSQLFDYDCMWRNVKMSKILSKRLRAEFAVPAEFPSLYYEVMSGLRISGISTGYG